MMPFIRMTAMDDENKIIQGFEDAYRSSSTQDIMMRRWSNAMKLPMPTANNRRFWPLCADCQTVRQASISLCSGYKDATYWMRSA